MSLAKIATLAGVALIALTAGCATTTTGPRFRTSALPVPVRAQVVVLDGAGGLWAAANSLDEVVREDRLPLAVVPYEWSHGTGRFIADQIDRQHLETQAEELARYLLVVRAQQPRLPIHVLAYSAGSAVITRAGKYLPPDTIDRVVLLAPAVAASTDVRPLLRAARQGVAVHTSRRDRLLLGLGLGIIGTTGGPSGRAAGVDGFDPVIESPRDAELHTARLHHFPWNSDYNWTGHVGQHGGSHEPRFLAAFILPGLLQCGR